MAATIDQPDDGMIRLPKTDSAMNKLAPAADRKDERKRTKPKSQAEKDKAILARARKRFDKCVTRESDNRKAALEALNFINGKQWSPDDLKARSGRPSITENHLKVFVNQVANAQRENRPAINISPDGDRGDIQVAKMLKGVIRKIQRECNADIAYDTAYWSACAIGWGWWRIVTDYESPETFDQTIEVRRVRNPFTVYGDIASKEPDGADMKYAFVTEKIERKEFESKYPNADPLAFTGINTGSEYREWIEQNELRIAEYFELDFDKVTLMALSNGWVGTEDELHDDIKAEIDAGRVHVTDERETEVPHVRWYKITAKEILERKDWPGKWIPLVKVIGNEVDIEGKVTYSGVVGDAIDPQRRLNFWSSLETELLGLQPKAPWVIAEGQIEGHESSWNQANTTALPYLTYKPTTIDNNVVPPPQRQSLPGIPAGLVEGRNAASQAMMATTGIRFDATMHERLNDESGKALREIRRSTDIGTYHFIDNLTRSLIQTGRILVDLIGGGKVMDTKRILSIVRDDDKEEQVQLDPNQAKPVQEVGHPSKPGQKLTSINPRSGKYSVTVTIGPDNATKRIEAVDNLMKVVKTIPQVGAVASDIIVRNLDGEGMDELATRLNMTIPMHLKGMPQLKHLPPEAQGMIGSLMQQVQQMGMQQKLLVKALTEKQTEQSLKKDKIDKDFEAKLLAVLQKAAAANKADEVQRMGLEAKELEAMLNAHVGAMEAMQGGESQ